MPVRKRKAKPIDKTKPAEIAIEVLRLLGEFTNYSSGVHNRILSLNNAAEQNKIRNAAYDSVKEAAFITGMIKEIGEHLKIKVNRQTKPGNDGWYYVILEKNIVTTDYWNGEQWFINQEGAIRLFVEHKVKPLYGYPAIPRYPNRPSHPTYTEKHEYKEPCSNCDTLGKKNIGTIEKPYYIDCPVCSK